MPSIDWREVRVFHGEITSQAAKVYAQLPAGALSAARTLRGEVRGPFCTQARTLPASMAMQYLGADPAPLAAAHVPDPSLWLPELPSLYQVCLRIEERGQIVDQAELSLGLRRFSPQVRSFLENHRRVVLRGGEVHDDVERTALRNAEHAERWRGAMLHQVMRDSQPELEDHLRWADESGIAIAVVASSVERFADMLQCLSRHPSVSLVLATGDVVEQMVSGGESFQAACNSKGRLSLAAVVDRPSIEQWIGTSDAPVWRRLFSATAHLAGTTWSTATWPQIVVGDRATVDSIDDPVIGIRRACELLQRDHSQRGDFAGYLVCRI